MGTHDWEDIPSYLFTKNKLIEFDHKTYQFDYKECTNMQFSL